MNFRVSRFKVRCSKGLFSINYFLFVSGFRFALRAFEEFLVSGFRFALRAFEEFLVSGFRFSEGREGVRI